MTVYDFHASVLGMRLMSYQPQIQSYPENLARYTASIFLKKLLGENNPSRLCVDVSPYPLP